MGEDPRKQQAAAPEEPWDLFQELAADVRERFANHRIGAESARIAYYFFLSLLPFLLALFTLSGFLGREALFNWIMYELLGVLPPQAALALEDAVRQITHVRRPGTLALASLLTIWSGSHALAALTDGLNAAFRVRSRRRWWQKGALGVGVVASVSVAVLLGALAVLAGPEIGGLLGLSQLGSLLRWPVALGLVIGLTWLCYFLLPDRKQRRNHRHLLGGAAVATALWAASTLLFRLYLSSFGRLDVVYGLLGGVVALLFWLYLAAMSVLVGGEVAAGLERHTRRRRARPADRKPTKAKAKAGPRRRRTVASRS